MRRKLLFLAFLFATLLPATGCTFYSVATHWNGRVGPEGEPIHYATVTKVGINLLILIPFLGATNIDSMVDVITEEVQRRGGNVVRVVQSSNGNYWYGWSPLTWIITPVVSTIAVDYQPSEEELERYRLER